jgi:hypothetical protein
VTQVLAKTSKSIAAYYESLLVPEDLQGISERVWQELDDTMSAILEIIKGNPMMGSGMENARLSIAARVPLVDPINVLQANVLLRMRADETQPDIEQLRDAFAITVQGVAAGLISTRCPLPPALPLSRLLSLLPHWLRPLVVPRTPPLPCWRAARWRAARPALLPQRA